MNPSPKPRILCLVLPAVLAIGLLGCMKRKETISVARDGSVSMKLKYEADSLEELQDGDALPSAATGWKVEREVEIDDQGKENHRFTATKKFSAGTALPAHYADPSDPDADLYLQFPTRVTLEERPDGAYYHFYRAYPQRRHWAGLDRISDTILEGPEKRLGDKKEEDWTKDDWLIVLEALVKLELVKMTSFARAAFTDVFPDAPQDTWLAVRTALHTITDGLDGDRVASLLMNTDDKEFERALEAEAEAFEAKALKLMTSALPAYGYGAEQAAEFADRYLWYKRHYEISEDLYDESFKIRVDMPGEIVATDADEVEGSRAVWNFDAKAIRDGGVELMVTSRVVR